MEDEKIYFVLKEVLPSLSGMDSENFGKVARFWDFDKMEYILHKDRDGNGLYQPQSWEQYGYRNPGSSIDQFISSLASLRDPKLLDRLTNDRVPEKKIALMLAKGVKIEIEPKFEIEP